MARSPSRPTGGLERARPSATAAESAIQAAAAGHGGTRPWRRVNATRPAAEPGRIVGHDEMVTRLGAELREHDIVNVVGLPGVGKSTVVSAYASSAEEGQDEPRLTTAWLGLSDDTL